MAGELIRTFFASVGACRVGPTIHGPTVNGRLAPAVARAEQQMEAPAKRSQPTRRGERHARTHVRRAGPSLPSLAHKQNQQNPTAIIPS